MIFWIFWIFCFLEPPVAVAACCCRCLMQQIFVTVAANARRCRCPSLLPLSVASSAARRFFRWPLTLAVATAAGCCRCFCPSLPPPVASSCCGCSNSNRLAKRRRRPSNSRVLHGRLNCPRPSRHCCRRSRALARMRRLWPTPLRRRY